MSNFELQNLIHALDKSEKIRFKEYCDEGAHYTALFDDLNESATCSEKGFKSNHADCAYFKRYSYNKGYLFNALLEAMRSQRQRGGMEKQIQFQVAEWLEDAEFLHDKMLKELCAKRLKKAEKEAEKFELHEEWLKILRFQGKLLMAGQRAGYQGKIEIVFGKISELTEVIGNKFAFLELRNRLLMISRTVPEVRGYDLQQSIRKISSNNLLSEVGQANSFDARLNYHFCHVLLGQIQADDALYLSHYQAIYHLWLDNPHFQKSRTADFRNSLNNYLIICCATHHFPFFVEAVTLLEEGPFRSRKEAEEVKLSAFYVRLQYFITICKWEDAEEIEREFTENFKDELDPDYRKKGGRKALEKGKTLSKKLIPSRSMAFFMSFARLNLIQGNLDKAIYWNNRVLKVGNAKVRKDIHRHAQLVSMILYYETWEVGKLENRYRAVVRSFSKEELTLEYERIVLEMLNGLPRLTTKAEVQKNFKELLERMQALEANPGERKAQGFNFIKSWLEAKVSKQELRVIFEAQLEG